MKSEKARICDNPENLSKFTSGESENPPIGEFENQKSSFRPSSLIQLKTTSE
ncbi:hypothetical protein [Flavobacterium sp.]|uniref:hypothetical protein n=1 Tax=Flavobacterium sp. TaxID=239 RepID=UPI0025B8AF6A|nr:hypothetical protein [Flavobacterium sp.]